MHSWENQLIHKNKAQTQAYTFQTKSGKQTSGQLQTMLCPEKHWLALPSFGQTQAVQRSLLVSQGMSHFPCFDLVSSQRFLSLAFGVFSIYWLFSPIKYPTDQIWQEFHHRPNSGLPLSALPQIIKAKVYPYRGALIPPIRWRDIYTNQKKKCHRKWFTLQLNLPFKAHQ